MAAVVLPCPLLSLLPLMPGFFMVPDRVTLVWPPKSTQHRLNALLFHFPISSGCAGLAITGCVGAAVSPHSVPEPAFFFTGGAVCLASPSLSLVLLPVFSLWRR